MATVALQLFRDRGYEAVSAAEIATCAGVTERTFFRHFPTKREVLFDGEAVLRDALLEAIAKIPAKTPPLETLLLSFRAIAELLESNRPFAEPRQQIVERTPALAERELAKIAALTETLAQALRERGTGDPAAGIAAQIAMGILTQATVSWLADPRPTLIERLSDATAALKSLVVEL